MNNIIIYNYNRCVRIRLCVYTCDAEWYDNTKNMDLNDIPLEHVDDYIDGYISSRYTQLILLQAEQFIQKAYAVLAYDNRNK